MSVEDRGHLDAELAADLDEGLLDDDRASAARAHAATCAECGALVTALSGLRSRLAADDPGPAPLEVVLRLDAALAAGPDTGARPDTAGAPADGPDALPPVAAVVPAPVRRPRHSRVRTAVGLAAGVTVLGGVLVGLGQLGGQLSSSGGGSSSAGRSADNGARSSGGGSASSRSVASASSVPAPASAPSAVPLSRSGTTFSGRPDALLRQARRLLAAAGSVPTAAGGRAEEPVCVRALPGPPAELVDVGRYQGGPAVLVVQRRAGRLVATLLSGSCSTADTRHPLVSATGPPAG